MGLAKTSCWRSEDLITEGDIMEMLARQKALNFVPGNDFSYCNTGYTLLGIAVKKITGVSLRDYADSVFFKPLGMYNTHFHSDHAEITLNRTSAYLRDNNGKWKISIPVFDTYGATSLFTTVEDLARWDENFYSKKIGNDAFVNAMQFTGTLNNKTPETYASGLRIQTYKGYKIVEHSGGDAGYRSYMLRIPEQHFSVIILANLANINAASVSYKVADLFLNDKSIKFLNDKSIKNKLVDIKTDSAILKSWAGTYLNQDSKSTVVLKFKNGKLFRNQDTLKAVNNTQFTHPYAKYTLSGDSVNAVLLVQIKGTIDKTYKKLKNIVLTPKQLEEYQGRFYSSELDTKYNIYVKDNDLYLKLPRTEGWKLSPMMKDLFTSGPVTIEYMRDKKKINGFIVYTLRTRNIHFEKEKAN